MISPGGAPLSIVDGVRGFAAAQPRVAAVVDGDRVQTYAELDERSSRVATALLAGGLEPGDAVAVLLGNRLEYCEVAAGLAKAGLVMVPLNPRMTGPEVDYIVGHSGARALILDEALAGIADGVAPGLHLVLSLDGESLGPSYETALAEARAVDPRVRVDEQDPFCVAYTSGTTGKPKGVLISHRSRSLTFTMSALEYGLGTGRRSIAVAPMYHGAGFAFGYAPVYTGGTVSMLRGWDPEAFLAMIERDRAQSVFLVPTHAQMLRNLTEDPASRFDLSSLDTIYFNAAALPTPLKEWVLDAFPGAGIHELYGSTEGGIISNLRPLDARRKAGSVGHPWHFTEVRVVDDEGQPVAPGEPGELFSRSPYLMNGYLDDDEATKACTTDDGFLTCGDVVTVDDEGFIRIVDRKKDLIISGGVNVYPRDVEEAVLTVPGVREVAVVGVPHETWGEQVVAYVVTSPGADVSTESIDAHLRGTLAAYKIPRDVVTIEALPRNASGKVLKRDLRDTYTV
ncbi:MAG: AMP-binding protein [Candidatus Nanopelagicales bacterium]